ncbi:YkvA family protein [Rufibacter psychrotolerans]|uniref:YkvA family protein n=1 Tax=Rufibacter psychrotolerans TaxID=2812556 RepID=UPI001966FA6A|nr:YkvA family protein [Rufibacter sp. SYSU D00308]
MENQTNNTRNVHESSVFKRFMKSAEEYLKQPLRIKQLLNDAYKKASEKKDFGTIAGEVFESLASLSRMIKAAVSGEYKGIPTNTVVMGVAVLIYFLSPIDLVPDWLPVIGLLDDVSLLAWFMTTIKSEIDKFHAWEAAQPVKSTTADPGAELATAMSVDTSAHTPKYSNEPAGQYGTDRVTAPSNSGLGSSAQQQNPTYGEGNMQLGNDSTGSQGSTGGIIPNQHTPQVTNLHPVEGTPVQEIDPTATHDAQPTDHGVPTGYGEPNVRASTTDSTRVPSSNSYDTDHGGNVR